MDAALLRTMLSFSPTACLIVGHPTRIVACNAAASQDHGLKVGDDLEDHFDLADADLANLEQCFGRSSQNRFSITSTGGETLRVVGWRITGRFREEKLIALQLVAAHGLGAEFAQLTRRFRQHITEVRQAQLENLKLAQQNSLLSQKVATDQMTGLLNGQTLRARMTAAISANRSFGLLYIDMNGLKKINDSFGHAAGDRAIMELATTLRSNSRAQDELARLGGDEFAMVAYGVETEEDLIATGNNIVRALAGKQVVLADGMDMPLSAAIGAARWPADATTVQNIEKLADFAMYTSKRSGQSVVTVAGATSRKMPLQDTRYTSRARVTGAEAAAPRAQGRNRS